MRSIERAIEESRECLSHRRAFHLFFGEDGADSNIMKDISTELYALIERDIRKAHGSSDERRYERIAAEILIQDYLRPLGALKEADAIKNKDVADERSVLGIFESGMKKAGLLKSTSAEEISSLRDEVLGLYATECRSLVYEADGTFERASEKDGNENGRFGSIDMGSFGYDRHEVVGEYIDLTTSWRLGSFGRRRHQSRRRP